MPKELSEELIPSSKPTVSKLPASNLSKSWVDGTLTADDMTDQDRRAMLQPNGPPDAKLGVKRLVSRTPKLVRDPKTEPPVPQMFRDRMKREGRGEELNAAIREVCKEHGLSYQAALQIVMPRMGFVNTETEIRIYREHRKRLFASAGETEFAEETALERARTEEGELAEAMASLPANAPKSRELDWIEAHPAMMRSSRNKANGYGSNTVQITADDVLNAPHGPCPSRAAAVQLQHWANNSTKFFEQIMSEAKKKSSDGTGSGGAGAEGAVEDDLSEIQDLIDFS